MSSRSTNYSKSDSLNTKEESEKANSIKATEREEKSPSPDKKAVSRPNNLQKKPQAASFWQKYWWLLPVLGIVFVIGGVAYWRLRDKAEQETAATSQTQIAPLTVTATTAALEPIRAWISSEGTVRAVDYKHLAFEVEGDVIYLADRDGRRLREGDRVSQGELLARVDDRQLLADISQAEAAVAEAKQNRAAAAAEVARARAQLQQARSQVQQARARVDKAQTTLNLARTELERYRLLYREGAIATSEFDTRVNAVEDARADLAAIRAEVAAAREEVRAARAQVEAAREQYKATQSGITTAEARLTQAEVALEGARLYAPFDGIVAYLNITEGEYYSPQIVTSQLAGDYQSILNRIPLVIIDPAQYEVIVDLAGPTGEQVRSGQMASIASERQNPIANARAMGEVFAVNPAISPGGRAIEARIRLDPETTSNVRHGERVTAWIAVDSADNAVVVPLNAVVYRDRVPYIFAIDPERGTVEQRRVTLGIKGITRQQITSGVTPGETVVTQGQNRLVDGAPVRVVERR